MSMPLGFVVGFWAILGPLAIKKAWRDADFLLLDSMKCKLYGCCYFLNANLRVSLAVDSSHTTNHSLIFHVCSFWLPRKASLTGQKSAGKVRSPR